MNEDTLKTINKLILQSDTRILISGPSCIGKTHFSHYLRSQVGFVGVCDGRYIYPKLESMYFNTLTKSNGVIIIGVPFDTYKERRILRGKLHKHDQEKFKQKYIKIIKKLEEYNIPHIFVDSRNDYPILDKSDFFTMLTECL